MSDYDFNRVFESLEFQNFARDMAQVKETLFFESFAEGSDLWIDGRCVLKEERNIYYPMTIGSCAESIDLKECDIVHNCCIDKALIENIIDCRLKIAVFMILNHRYYVE